MSQTKRGQLTYEDLVRGLQHLKPEEQLSLLEIISARLKKTFGEQQAEHSILELEGLGSDIWEGMDAQEYVSEERQSWD